MKIPYVNQVNKSTSFTQRFSGYNHNLKAVANSQNGAYQDDTVFFDMENMTLDDYPVIGTRKGRKSVTLPEGTGNLSVFPAGDRMLLALGTKLYFGDPDDEWTQIYTGLENSHKQFAAIGSKILILPDGLMVNTHDSSVTVIAQSAESSTLPVTITPCILGDNGNYENITYVSQDTAPDDHGVYWYDTRNNVLKKYSTVSYTWVGVGTAFLRIQANENDTALKALFANFKAWDTMSFTTLTCTNPDRQEELDKIAKNSGEDGKGDNVLYEVGEDYVVVAGIVLAQITTTAYKIERRIPEMDFITSLNNRIWGCSSANHEIHACKLGDPTQWFNFPGVASDSYYATIGSFGDFTGATSLNGYALFFKENSMFKVYGDYPANFQVAEIVCDGVQKGSEQSIRELNGALYYKGINGIMIYDGSIPQEFTDVFGSVQYGNAVAGAVRGKYFVSMSESNGVYSLFVYDTNIRMWVKEDHFQAQQMIAFRNCIYAVDNEESLYAFPMTSETDDIGGEDAVISWMVQTGNMGLDNPMQKYISRIQLRFEMTGKMKISVQYNGGIWHKVFERRSKTLRSFTVPVKVRRCDHFAIRMEGDGFIRLYSYGYNTETGSERC